jgi:hypothetical protein
MWKQAMRARVHLQDRRLVWACVHTLGMSMMSLLFCSVVVIRVSVMNSKVFARDCWALLIYLLIDARNRISVRGRSSLSSGTKSSWVFVGVSSTPVMLSMKCNPTVCRLSDNLVLISFLLPVVDSGGGSWCVLIGIAWHVPHGSQNVLQCRIPHLVCPHPRHMTRR